MYMYGGPLEIFNIYTYVVGSLIEAHLFRSVEEDEECDYITHLLMILVHKVVTRKIEVLENTIQIFARMLSKRQTLM